MSNIAYRRHTASDFLTAGPAAISGIVRELTTPVAGREVFLLRQADLAVRRRSVSGVGGAYSFPNIAAGTEWLVLAIDPNAAYNAVVADRVAT